MKIPWNNCKSIRCVLITVFAINEWAKRIYDVQLKPKEKISEGGKNVETDLLKIYLSLFTPENYSMTEIWQRTQLKHEIVKSATVNLNCISYGSR